MQIDSEWWGVAEGTIEEGPDGLDNVAALIDFLEAYYRLARPPIRDIADFGEFRSRESNLPDGPGVHLSPSADAWLTAELVQHPSRPEIPDHLLGWIDKSQLSPHQPPDISLDDDATEEALDAAIALDTWIDNEWEQWSRRWKRVERSRVFYKDLYAVRSRLERDQDSFELVWGFGRLRWTVEQGRIDHPLVTVPVTIDVDSNGRLQVSPDGAPVIEATFLSDVKLADHAGFLKVRTDPATLDVDIWGPEERGALLDHLLRLIDHDGERDPTGPAAGSAIVHDEWVIYLRRRQADYLGFLQAQRQLYESGETPSLPFASLVTERPSELPIELFESTSTSATPRDDTLYLPKEANSEQERILRLARDRPGVTAQGPPGTGKSHTIANLVCHFVAQGKRVLVTAEKEQALAVLNEKLPPAVRELSVTIGGGGTAANTAMERAISTIQDRVSAYDEREVARDIDTYATEIQEIDAAVALATNQLREARAAETQRLTGAFPVGDPATPSRVAEWVAEHQGELSFIPDVLPLDRPSVLDPGEWATLLDLLAHLDVDDVAACALERPIPADLASGGELARLAQELRDLRSTLATVEDGIESWEQLDAGHEMLTGLHEDVTECADWMRKVSGTWLDKVRQESAAAIGRGEWQEFADGISAAREAAVTFRRQTAAHEVAVPGDRDPELDEGLRDARQRYSAGKGVSWVQRTASRALDQCTVDGHLPRTADEVDLCVAALDRQDRQRELTRRWHNGTSRVGGPELDGGRPAEDAVQEHLDGLTRAINWIPDEWPALSERVRAMGIQCPADPDVEDLDRLAETLGVVSRRARERALTAYFDDLRRYLANKSGGEVSPLWNELREALESERWETWDQTVSEAARLAALETRAERRRQLSDRLHEVAPKFLRQLETMGQPDLPQPSIVERAWTWRQLECWLDSIAALPSTGELQRQLEHLARQRRTAMERLVAAKAWRGLARNFTDANRMALNKYLTAVKRYGKTGGKYAARWRREMRDALNESKDAVPVWIMPISRALESFRPSSPTPFDVLIVDEASQIGLLGTPVLALANRAIVVGDDQQTSPENVGLERQGVFNLIDAHLNEVRDSRTLFDGDNSLYDVSKQKFPEVVSLREHFRCLPAIIRFSNGRYYGDMIPLRDRAPSPSWQPLGTVFVPDGFRDGDVNEPEALATVDLIAELIADRDYDGMTFGVIALLGKRQSLRVQELLIDRLGPEVLEERRIRCGEAADFQGDERNVIVLNTVVDRPEGRRIGTFTDRKSERRMNVAASRAKDQMWVVHSIPPEDFPNGDPRAELIRHCTDPSALDETMANLDELTESPFESAVLREILERGYRTVRVQHEVGHYRIDIVVEGPSRSLAVECDGDRWHTADQWDADRARQQILERAGWTFERIRGSSFYRDRKAALEPLWARLDELEIPTGDWASGGVELSTRRVAPTMAERREIDPPEPVGTPVASSVEPGPQPPRLATEAIAAATEVEHAPSAPDDAAPAIAPPTREVAPELTEDLDPGSLKKSSRLLSEYSPWTPRSLHSVHDGAISRIGEELVEIASAEGPMHVLFLFQVHAKASGNRRVGREMRRFYLDAFRAQEQRGHLSTLNDDVEDDLEKTVVVPGRPFVIVRQLGPRQIHEVPRSEIKTLAESLGFSGRLNESEQRHVLREYGLKKLTQKTEHYLDGCIAYRWSPPNF